MKHRKRRHGEPSQPLPMATDAESPIKKFWQHLCGVVVAGWVVSALLFASQKLAHGSMAYVQAVTSVQSRLADFIAYQLSPGNAPARASHSPRIVLLDFSEIGSDAERRGSAVPRGDLAALVRQADDAGARVVLIDFSLSGPGDDNAALNSALHEVRHTQVVVPAWLTQRTSDACIEDEARRGRGGAPPRERMLFAQQVLADVGPRLWLGHDDIEVDFDGRVRSFCPVTRAQWQSGARLSVELPSTALLATVLATQGSARIGKALDGCEQSEALVLSLARQARSEVGVAGIEGPVCGITPEAAAPRHLGFVQDADTNPGSPHRLPDTEFLHLKLTPGQPALLDADALRDAIVVIGASHEMSTDKVLTPLGVMPGVMLLVNVIHESMAQGLAEHAELSMWLEILIEMLVVVVGAFLFVLLQDGGVWLGRQMTGGPAHSQSHPAVRPHRSWTAILRELPHGLARMLWIMASAALALFFLVWLLVCVSGITAAYWPGMIDLSGAALGMLLDLGARMDEAAKQLFGSEDGH